MISLAKRYVVRDVFDTIQGEGYHAGRRAVFLRFAGCNLWSGLPKDREKGKGACARWCDADFAKGTPLEASELLETMNKQWARPMTEHDEHGEKIFRTCVLTGGEPMLQVDAALIQALTEAGWRVNIETNGTRPIHPEWDCWITFSPKLSVGVEWQIHEADEVKVVLPGSVEMGHGWSTELLEMLERDVPAWHYFVQPMDPPLGIDTEHSLHHPKEGAEIRGGIFKKHVMWKEAVKQCIAFVKTHPRWRISVQAHKWLEVP